MKSYASFAGELGNLLASVFVFGALERGIGGMGTAGSGATAVTNPVPRTLARVIPGNVRTTSLGAPGAADAFVTDATAVEGLTAGQIARKLTIDPSPSGFQIFEFPSAGVNGIASPIRRTNPGFVGGGRTAGGAPEYVVPNMPIPADATRRIVP